MLAGVRRSLPVTIRRSSAIARATTCDAHHTIGRALSTLSAEPIDGETASAAHVEEVVAAAERRILSLFERYGRSDYIGEDMTITEHSVQTANAAAAAGEDETAVLACLLHDVGHLAGLEAGHPPGMDGCGTPEHELVGARLLGALGLPEDVSYLARHHVDAKRYLCATQPDYYAKLSAASKTTLLHQGGPMSEEEVCAAEADPRWPIVLRMRGYDEAGKDAHAAFSSVEQFVPLLRSAVRGSVTPQLMPWSPTSANSTTNFPLSPYARSYVLSDEQTRFWHLHGYLLVRGALPQTHFGGATLAGMANEAAALPSGACYPWLLHHERSRIDGAVRICRVENYVKHHATWSSLAHGPICAMVSQAFGEPAVLFRDTINFEGPGGGGFMAHQDATAYATDTLATRHISVLIAIDEADETNGPLEVPSRPELHSRGIFDHRHGVIKPAIEAELSPWTSLHVSPGDMVLFDSYLPHRSAPNASSTWRRSAYLTFNRAAEGDCHAEYYATKHEGDGLL